MFELDDKNQVLVSDLLWAVLKKVNDEINAIPYETDSNIYGREEWWSQYADKIRRADCDDYTLTKRRKLIEAGVPYECLCPAGCYLGDEGHLVLIVRTSQGAYVMCNNLEEIKPWRRLKTSNGIRYNWINWFDPVDDKWRKFK